jgi:hypothetical protein
MMEVCEPAFGNKGSVEGFSTQEIFQVMVVHSEELLADV